MKIKLTNLTEGVIITNPQTKSFGNPSSVYKPSYDNFVEITPEEQAKIDAQKPNKSLGELGDAFGLKTTDDLLARSKNVVDQFAPKTSGKLPQKPNKSLGELGDAFGLKTTDDLLARSKNVVDQFAPKTSGKLPEQPMDRSVRQFKNREEEEKGAWELPEPDSIVNKSNKSGTSSKSTASVASAPSPTRTPITPGSSKEVMKAAINSPTASVLKSIQDIISNSSTQTDSAKSTASDKTINQPGMTQQDLERDADKWAQQNQKSAATSAPTSTSTQSEKPKTQYGVNQAEVQSQHEKFKERMARRTERANLLTQTSRAEAEAVEADNALMRARHPSTYGRGGRSRGGSGIFEQRALQFKPGALKTLLHLQEGGVYDTAAATWDFAKDYANDVWNQGFVTGTKKAAGKLANSAVKGIEDTTGTEYFTKGAIHPNIASREFVKMTKEVPGDNTLNIVKNLARYSPLTLARMQANRYARAAAFDPSEAEETISHYAKVHAMTNPLSYATGYAGKVASGIQAMAGLAPALGTALGGAVGGPVGSNVGKLTGAALGLATSVGAGLAANTANKIVAPAIAAQAREAARLDAARLKDWRFAVI